MSRTTTPKRTSRDDYPTPEWCIKLLASELEELPVYPDIIIDMGCGDGRIGRIVSESLGGLVPHSVVLIDTHLDNYKIPELTAPCNLIHGCAVHAVQNASIPYGDTALIVSNPPFNQAIDLARAALDLIHVQQQGSAAVFLLRLDWLGALKRASFVNKYPPSRVHILAPRPCFRKIKRIDKDGKEKWSTNDSGEYAWVWWETVPTKEQSIKVLVDPTKETKYDTKKINKESGKKGSEKSSKEKGGKEKSRKKGSKEKDKEAA